MSRFKLKFTNINSRMLFKRIMLILGCAEILLIVFFILSSQKVLENNYKNQTKLLETHNSNLNDFIETYSNALESASINTSLLNAAYRKTEGDEQNDLYNLLAIQEVNAIARSFDYVDSVYFISNRKQLLFSSIGGEITKKYQFFDIAWTSNFTPGVTGVQFISSPRKVINPSGYSAEYVSIACPVPNLSCTNNGILIFNFQTRDLYKHIFPSMEDDTCEYFIFDGNSAAMLSHSDSEIAELLVEGISNLKKPEHSGYKIMEFEKTKYVVSYIQNETFNWTLISMTPRQHYFEALFPSLTQVIILAIAFIAATIMFSYSLAQDSFRPVDMLAEKIEKDSDSKPADDDKLKFIEQAYASVRRYGDDAHTTVNAYSTVLNEKVILQIINKNDIDTESESKFVKTLSLLGQTYIMKNSCVGVVKLDLNYEFEITYYEFQKKLKRELAEITSESFKSIWLWSDPTTLIGILHVNDTLTDKLINISLTDLGEQIQQMCGKICNEPSYIAFGNIKDDIKALNRSYSEALELIYYKMHNKLFTPYCYSLYSKSELTLDYNKKELLTHYIKLGKSDEACMILDSYFSVMSSYAATDTSYLIYHAKEIIGLICKTQSVTQTNNENIQDEDKLCKQLDNLDSTNEIAKFVLHLAKEACEKSQFKSKTKAEGRMRELFDWVDKNYKSDISLESLAEHVGCSPTYLSKLFKAHAGTSVVIYVNNLRINHTKQLLLTTQMTLPEISLFVGFNHQQSFIRSFKKLVGMTPSEYRAVNNEKKD